MTPASRRQFLQHAAALGTLTTTLAPALAAARALGPVSEQPALFIGHGSPLNALRDNPFTAMLRQWGERLGTPAAMLVVSAHWLTPGQTAVDVQERPPTIHDFGGFPRALHEMQYPAPGAPGLARLTAQTVKSTAVVQRSDWGLDHGTWSVLTHLFPRANIPVFQLSLDYAKPGAYHLALGRELAPLRSQGVLIVGSGNIVHNLGRTERGVTDGPMASQPWAQSFDEAVKAALAQREDAALADAWTRGDAARLSVPTPDHYFPLLYALGAARPGVPPQTVFEGFQSGTLSMRCLQFGA